MAASQPRDLRVLHDDGLCLVVDKPGGLLTQAPPDIDSVELRLKEWFRDQNPDAKQIYCGVPHRLDRPATGAMLFSRNATGTKHLGEQFRNRSVTKLYWTIVGGEVSEPAGSWTDYMRKVPGQPRSEIVASDHPDAQLAMLRYRCLASSSLGSLLEIQLETGRTHQIRLQASSRCLPILGDELYGSTHSFGPPSFDKRARWIALHARQLNFDHPTLRRRFRIVAPLFAHWAPFLEQFDVQQFTASQVDDLQAGGPFLDPLGNEVSPPSPPTSSDPTQKKEK